jgi:hypothetical protein
MPFVRIVTFVLCAAFAVTACAQTGETTPAGIVFVRATLLSVRDGVDVCKLPELPSDKGIESILLLEGNCYALTLHIDRVLAGQIDKRTILAQELAQSCKGCTIGRQYLIIERRNEGGFELAYIEPLSKGLCLDSEHVSDFEKQDLEMLRDWQQRFPCRPDA